MLRRPLPFSNASTDPLGNSAPIGHKWKRELRLTVSLGACALALCFAARAQDAGASDYRRAEVLVRNHQWDEGIELLNRLLGSGSKSPRLLNLAGLAYTGKGDLAQADRYFRSALDVDPAFIPALKNLGINEVTLGAAAPAHAHLEAAARLAPADPVVNLYLGEIEFREQDFKAAANHLEQAGSFVQGNPNLTATLAVAELKNGDQATALERLNGISPEALSSKTQVTVGVTLAQLELPQQAVPYLQAAILSGEETADISYDLALCYISLKQYPEAIGVLVRASSNGHESADMDRLMAEAYEANHETQHAVASLRRSIALDPQNEDSYLEFASICIDHQDFDNAAKVLSVGLTARPKSSRLLFERGILNAMQDHFEMAEKDFQQAADLAPADNSAYVGLGVTFLETGDTARAIPLLRTRLKDHPGDANLSYLLGEALLRSGVQQGDPAFAEAQSCLEKAVRIDPKLVEPHISLGTLYLREGRLQDAVAQLERARALDPYANSAYSHLAIAYRRLGDTDKSRQVLTELKAVVDHERAGTRQQLSSAQNPHTPAAKPVTPQ